MWAVYSDILNHFLAICGAENIRAVVAQVQAMPAVGEDPAGHKHMELLPLPPFQMKDHLVHIECRRNSSIHSDQQVPNDEDQSESLSDDYNAPGIFTTDESSAGSSLYRVQ